MVDKPINFYSRETDSTASMLYPSSSSVLNLTQVAGSADFNFSTNDFTLETHIRFYDEDASKGYIQVLFQIYLDATHWWAFVWHASAFSYGNGKLYFSGYGLPATLWGGLWQPALNTWYHVALTREGNTWSFWIDGVLSAEHTDAYSVPACSSAVMTIGGEGSLYPIRGGWLDEVRISDVARWSTGFTPSTSKYSSDGNTLLLLHFDEADEDTTTTDSSGYTRTITVAGDCEIDTDQKKYEIDIPLNFYSRTKDAADVPLNFYSRTV